MLTFNILDVLNLGYYSRGEKYDEDILRHGNDIAAYLPVFDDICRVVNLGKLQ